MAAPAALKESRTPPRSVLPTQKRQFLRLQISQEHLKVLEAAQWRSQAQYEAKLHSKASIVHERWVYPCQMPTGGNIHGHFEEIVHGGVAGLPCAHKESRSVGQGKLGEGDVGEGNSDGAQKDCPRVAAANAQQAAGEVIHDLSDRRHNFGIGQGDLLEMEEEAGAAEDGPDHLDDGECGGPQGDDKLSRPQERARLQSNEVVQGVRTSAGQHGCHSCTPNPYRASCFPKQDRDADGGVQHVGADEGASAAYLRPAACMHNQGAQRGGEDRGLRGLFGDFDRAASRASLRAAQGAGEVPDPVCSLGILCSPHASRRYPLKEPFIRWHDPKACERKEAATRKRPRASAGAGE
eukprot:6194539-Pleurochrysis_carterae.AAC.1